MVDIIIFTKDRACQLDALLRSIDKFAWNAGNVIILYAFSNNDYYVGYEKIKKRDITTILRYDWIWQNGFKFPFLKALNNVETKRVLILCDDVIFIRETDLNVFNAARSWQNNFNLLMGINITHCYASNKPQTVPKYTLNDTLKWYWHQSESKTDWGYPNMIGATIYKTWWLRLMAKRLKYDSPNQFEGKLNNKYTRLFTMPQNAAFYKSHALGLQINQVQLDSPQNRHGNNPQFSTENLNKLFLEGDRLKIEPYFEMLTDAAVIEPEMEFERCEYLL